MIASVPGPQSAAAADVIVPPPIVLPVPQFATWDEAVTYARGMFARTRYLEAQLGTTEQPGPLVVALSDAQIQLAAAKQELDDLLTVARNLLVQGQSLA